MSQQTHTTAERLWLACTRPEEMLAQLPATVSHRKLRLYAVACCRHVRDLLTDPRSRQAVEVSELFAEGIATATELANAGVAAQDVLRAMRGDLDFPWRIARAQDLDPSEQAAEAAWACTWESAAHAARASARCAGKAAWTASIDQPRTAENALLCALLRDSLGNPFQTVALDPAWLTVTVRAIARAVDAERRYADLPILGDALEEAGCTSAEILDHCRAGTPHARGCWIVDRILGKE